MSNETDILHAISGSPWTAIVTLISVVVVAVISGIAVISGRINRPKLELIPKIEIYSQSEKNLDLRFRIHIKNNGKVMAENCTARMKITDPSGKINIANSSIKLNEDFTVSMYAENGMAYNSVNLLPSKRVEATILIPIFIELLKKPDERQFINMPSMSIEFKDPIRNWNHEQTGTSRKYLFEVGINIFIVSVNRTFEKRFKLRIPQLENTIINPNKIQFKLKRLIF